MLFGDMCTYVGTVTAAFIVVVTPEGGRAGGLLVLLGCGHHVCDVI